MPKSTILSDFIPYIWYDISLYPADRKIGYTEVTPRVSLMVKFYDAESDSFKYYKVLDTSYHHKYGEQGSWNTPDGHRAVAFLHDGEDLPRWDSKHMRCDEPADFPLPLMDKGRRQAEKDREHAAFLASPLDTAEDVARSEMTHLRGQAQTLSFPEGTNAPDCPYYNADHSYNDMGRCLCGADVGTEQAVEMGR